MSRGCQTSISDLMGYVLYIYLSLFFFHGFSLFLRRVSDSVLAKKTDPELCSLNLYPDPNPAKQPGSGSGCYLKKFFIKFC